MAIFQNFNINQQTYSFHLRKEGPSGVYILFHNLAYYSLISDLVL